MFVCCSQQDLKMFTGLKSVMNYDDPCCDVHKSQYARHHLPLLSPRPILHHLPEHILATSHGEATTFQGGFPCLCGWPPPASTLPFHLVLPTASFSILRLSANRLLVKLPQNWHPLGLIRQPLWWPQSPRGLLQWSAALIISLLFHLSLPGRTVASLRSSLRLGCEWRVQSGSHAIFDT